MEQIENQEQTMNGVKIQLIQNKKTQLTELIVNLRQKSGSSLEKVFELYLETYISMVRQEKENDNFFQGQLTALEKVLSEKLNKEELEKITQLQREVLKLEEQLNIFTLKEQYKTEV